LEVIGFKLVRQALYHLGNASSPFCFSYFSDSVLCFAWAGFGQLCSYLCLLPSWDCRYAPQCSAYLLKWVLNNFLLVLASNHNPSDLYLLNRWGHRHELLYLALTSLHFLMGKDKDLAGVFSPSQGYF
jgi:hypothetical protein